MAIFPRRLRLLLYSAAAAALFAAALLSVEQIARATFWLPEHAANVAPPQGGANLTTAAALDNPEESADDASPEPLYYLGEYDPFGPSFVVSSTRRSSNGSAFEVPQVTLPEIAPPARAIDFNTRKLPAMESSLSVSQRPEDATTNPLGPFKLIVPPNPSSAGSELNGALSTSSPPVSAPVLPAGGLLRR